MVITKVSANFSGLFELNIPIQLWMAFFVWCGSPWKLVMLWKQKPEKKLQSILRWGKVF